ncbi:MAG: hypothetical protein QW767_00330 [Thermoprotei archaeon]
MTAGKLKAIKIVYAKWCPHCVPTTLEPMRKLASDLGVKFEEYDIDSPEKGPEADRLVKEHGDWSPDYVIPQVFFEYADGTVKHVMSGYSEGVEFTKRAVENLLRSKLVAQAKAA